MSIPDLTAEDAPAISAALASYAGIDRASLKFDPADKTTTPARRTAAAGS